MLRRFFDWLAGYVQLEIFGAERERFLNLAAGRGIDVSGVFYAADGRMFLRTDFRQLPKLKKIARQVGCRFKIRQKKGFPFFWRVLMRRKALTIGLLVFCALLFAVQNVVLRVEVAPQEELQFLSQAEVLTAAEELGLKPGVWADELDFDALARDINLQVPELSWVSLERQGTLIRIKVAERDIYSDAERAASEGAIIAEKDALLEDVLIKRGRAMVKAGDTVKKGTVMVAPDAEGKAEAIIRARVWYRGYGECALVERSLQPMAEPRLMVDLKKAAADGSVYELRLWGQPFTEGFVSSERQDVHPHLWDFCELPFTVSLTKNQPMVIKTQTLTDEEAKNIAQEQAKASLKQQIGAAAEILEQTAEPQKQGDVWCVDVVWECREEIGRHQEQ